MRVFVLAFALLLLTLSSAQRAHAETFVHFLGSKCPNAVIIAALQRRAEESKAMVEDRRYADSRALAREYYRCTKGTPDPYLRDAALLYYAIELENAAKTNGDEISVGTHSVVELNELAVRTRYGDIRSLALKWKTLIKNAVDKANDAIYGTPTQAPTAEPSES